MFVVMQKERRELLEQIRKENDDESKHSEKSAHGGKYDIHTLHH